MTSRKRITMALIGLIVLVVVGWFVQELSSHHRAAPKPSSAPAEAPASLSVMTWV